MTAATKPFAKSHWNSRPQFAYLNNLGSTIAAEAASPSLRPALREALKSKQLSLHWKMQKRDLQ